MITPDRLRFLRHTCTAGALLLLLVAAAAQNRSAKDLRTDYALIFGTVWDKQERPVYGAVVKIRREGEKKAHWELMSDHSGEFAQRVPPGKADYVVWVDDTRNVSNPQVARRKLKPGETETKVHIEQDERVDIGLRLKN